MRVSFHALVVATTVAVLTACDNTSGCHDEKDCGPALTVTFQGSIPVQQDLALEIVFDGRTLRCQPRSGGLTQCDAGISVAVRTVVPDAGPQSNSADWPAYVDDVKLIEASPDQATVRVLHGDTVVAERSMSPTYREDHGTCLTCRWAQESM